MLHLLLYLLTIIVNSTDCHKTPWKHQFVDDSHSLVIWKPFSPPTLLLNLEHHHHFISHMQYSTKTVTEVHLPRRNAYKVQGKRENLENKVRSVPPEYSELNYFDCRTVKYPDTAWTVYWETGMEEPKCGSWLFRTQHIDSSSSWGSRWSCTPLGASTGFSLFARETKLMWSSYFSCFGGENTISHLTVSTISKERGKAWHY